MNSRASRLPSLGCHGALLCGALAIAAVNAAVPAVSADLATTPAGTRWFAAAYQLACGPLQLGAGRVADRRGQRGVLLGSLAVFAAGGLLAATATDATSLVAARLVQGAGGSALSPVSLALLLTLRDTEEGAAPRAVAGWVSTAAAASCLGPLLGGLLTELLGWRAVFTALTVLALLTAGCLLSPRAAVTVPPPPREPLDAPGIALCAAAATAALVTLTTPATAVPAAGVLTVLVGLLVLRVRRVPHAALDTGLLRRPATRRALLVLLTLFAAHSAFTFQTAFVLTRAHGLGPFGAALATLPSAVPAVLTARLAGTRSGDDGARPMRAGLLCVAVGLLTGCAGRCAPTPVPLLLCAFALMGCGLGLANGSAMTTIGTAGRSARATATATTFAMLGGASGPAATAASATLTAALPTPCGPLPAGNPQEPQHALPLIALTTLVLAFVLTRGRDGTRAPA
ncbi:MFS transporter [Streptomyces luteireticuli]|uniref:Major facilitator superfamily (MFS) profile domain-containing protein n=1 Tax=Streptomyces luteireticuli TaxID=173858 RepID=A0ABN0YPP7_9ACTN